MLSRASVGVVVSRQLCRVLVTRNFGASAACQQVSTSSANADPIQKLFVDKIHEYAQKSKSAGNKLVDASPATEKALADELEKLAKQFGAKGTDFTKFPTFSFSDPDLDPIGSGEIKLSERPAAEHHQEEDDSDDVPYFDIPPHVNF